MPMPLLYLAQHWKAAYSVFGWWLWVSQVDRIVLTEPPAWASHVEHMVFGCLATEHVHSAGLFDMYSLKWVSRKEGIAWRTACSDGNAVRRNLSNSVPATVPSTSLHLIPLSPLLDLKPVSAHCWLLGFPLNSGSLNCSMKNMTLNAVLWQNLSYETDGIHMVLSVFWSNLCLDEQVRQ